jgi:hypothetical protein
MAVPSQVQSYAPTVNEVCIRFAARDPPAMGPMTPGLGGTRPWGSERGSGGGRWSARSAMPVERSG